jgi:hypothetical protein
VPWDFLTSQGELLSSNKACGDREKLIRMEDGDEKGEIWCTCEE